MFSHLFTVVTSVDYFVVDLFVEYRETLEYLLFRHCSFDLNCLRDVIDNLCRTVIPYPYIVAQAYLYCKLIGYSNKIIYVL